MLLKDFLKKENNNLELIRILAAYMVFLGHAFVLSGDNYRKDPVFFLTGFTYSGALAVKVFFFISGLVVTNSLIEKRNIVNYFTARFFRIFPAFFALLILTSFLLGPVFTSLNLKTYFSDPGPYKYIFYNLATFTYSSLPGVFQNNHLQNVVNGSLWTLRFEFLFYLFLPVLYFISLKINKILVNIALIYIILEPLLPFRILTAFMSDNPDIYLLLSGFLTGVLAALNKNVIKIHPLIVFTVWIVCFLTWNSAITELLFCLSVFLLVMITASAEWFLKLRPMADISFGIYLYAFPVQQCFASLFPSQSLAFHLFMPVPVVFLLAAVSWYVIEKPGIRKGKFLLKNM